MKHLTIMALGAVLLGGPIALGARESGAAPSGRTAPAGAPDTETRSAGQDAETEQAWYAVAWRDLVVSPEEVWPPEAESRSPGHFRLGGELFPRVVVDGPGEAYVTSERFQGFLARDLLLGDLTLHARGPAGEALEGWIFVPGHDWAGMDRYRFTLQASQASAEAERPFWSAAARHFERLRSADQPGSAWFRHRAEAAWTEWAALGQPGEARPDGDAWRGNVRWMPEPSLDRTFDLFSGGRALAENLQLDAELAVRGESKSGATTVDVATIEGVTVRAIDWAERVEGLAPQVDPLARWIPADQHGLFFPSFDALVDVVDELRRFGTPVLALLEPRGEDARTQERYERQLCAELDALTRALGGQVVRSVAATGGDLYLRTGTDVALLFECERAEALEGFLRARQRAARDGAADSVELAGTTRGVAWEGVRTPDRRICAYLARVDDVVVLANSHAQLERVLATRDGERAALAESPEYVAFRDRYPRGAEAETAFAVLTDATIRRWCSPEARIGASRRTRALARIAELEARRLAAEVAEEVPPRLPAGYAYSDDVGVVSEDWGHLEFQTPVLELDVARVTEAERDAYQRFKSRYERNWSDVFDPIALRLGVGPARVGLDLTVEPLITGSDYRQLIELTGDARLAPDACDPHPEAILHLAFALDRESAPLRGVAGMAQGMAPSLGADPLGWLGSAVAVYADADPFWDEWAAAEAGEDFVLENLARLPVALHVATKDPLRLATFLTAVRSMSEQAAPGMTAWETRTWREVPYVRVAPTERFARGNPETPEFALYYASMPGSLVVTLSEPLLQRAIERQLAREERAATAEGAVAPTEPAWLGESAAVRTDRRALPLLRMLWRSELVARMQAASWANLEILNEWRRLFPGEDPLAVHARFWGTELVCPGGGGYVWNDAWHTMESTVYGHPGVPAGRADLPEAARAVLAAALGVTFEEAGLRARVELERELR